MYEPPQTQYAERDGTLIAYQVFGGGKVDLVICMGMSSNCDHLADMPESAQALEQLAAHFRVILFDRRGSGHSDPLPSDTPPTWEDWADDVLAVLDAIGSRRALIYGERDGGMMALIFASAHPDRTLALALANTSARVLVADDYPAGFTPEQADLYVQLIRDKWGTDELTRLAVPHITDARSIRMRSRYFRGAATPTQAASHWRYLFDFDARSFLPTISVPTIVFHRESFIGAPIEHGEYIAKEIANAKFVRLPGGDGSVLFNEDATERVGDLVEFVMGHPVERESSRSLKTVLFCDIVNSTKRAADLGDRDWHELLQRFYAIVREELGHFGGKEIDSVGDGFFMAFERPTRALNCASAIRDTVKTLHLQVRFGAHTGECTTSREKVTGMAVHIGARIAAAANADEIWVSETVKVLAMGSGIQFSARGTHELKGVPDQWSLYAVG